MKKINVGIIGCGVIAPAHIKSYQMLPDVEVISCCDLIREKAEKRAAEFGIKKIFTSYKEMLADKELDAVSICTDHESHTLLAVECLEAGKHVICEKSLASSKENLEKMLDAEKNHPELVFSGVFQHRFDSGYLYAKELVNNGVLGEILTADLTVMCLRTNEYYNADAWRGTWAKEGGALLINQAIHFIDMISWIMGGVKSVSAEYTNLAHKGIIECEDTASAAVVYKNGALGTISATSASPLSWQPTMTFNGTKGSLSIRDNKLFSLQLSDRDQEEGIRQKFAEYTEEKCVSKSYYGSGHPRQLNDFIEAIRSGIPLRVPAHSAAHAPSIVLSIYDSCRSGKRVAVEH